MNEDYCTEGCCESPDSFCNLESDNTPLQEQVEQQDKHIFQLEDALEKTVDVISALMGERKDLHDQLYQAQVDAQDWQNQFNAEHDAKRIVQSQALQWAARVDELRLQAGRVCDEEQIRELTNEVSELREQVETYERRLTCYPGSPENDNRVEYLENRIRELTNEVAELTAEVTEARELIANRQILLETCRDLYRQACEQNDKLEDRILELTDQNTQLEIRNERQAKRLVSARIIAYEVVNAINGLED